MTISKMIELLERKKEQLGDVEVVATGKSFLGMPQMSTVEDFDVVEFNGEKALLVDIWG